jgi:hypothetical protein
MNNHLLRRHDEVTMLSTLDTPYCKPANGTAASSPSLSRARKQRVTITLPHSLLERLRNAVYWTGHGPLARLISEALDEAVSQMEQTNGQAFPQRLAPLKRGRPRTKTGSPALPVSAESIQ